MKEQLFFEINSRLGVLIRITHSRWQLIVNQKHPEIKGKEKEIIKTIEDADEVRLSKKDHQVYLYYKKAREYFYCVVARHLNGEGFVITAYLTGNIKEGKLIWIK